jgi:hypothetical protein
LLVVEKTKVPCIRNKRESLIDSTGYYKIVCTRKQSAIDALKLEKQNAASKRVKEIGKRRAENQENVFLVDPPAGLTMEYSHDEEETP